MVYRRDIDDNPLRLISAPGSKYSHAFGGPLDVPHPKHLVAPFHLLFDLDLRDPALAFLELEGIERLPFIFPLRYDGADIGYRVKKGGRIEFFDTGKLTYDENWPHAGYPQHFPRVPVSVVPFTYEQYRATLFRHAVGPLDDLREDDRETVRAMGIYTQLGGVQEMPFGDPAHYCPNPGCRYHENLSSMAPIASLWNEPLPGVRLWGEDADVVIVYYLCTDCQSVYACNMCS